MDIPGSFIVFAPSPIGPIGWCRANGSASWKRADPRLQLRGQCRTCTGFPFHLSGCSNPHQGTCLSKYWRSSKRPRPVSIARSKNANHCRKAMAWPTALLVAA